MPGGHKYYLCPNERCGQPLRKYQLASHLARCRERFDRTYVGIRREGRLTKQWLCSGLGCYRRFRTEKACRAHVDVCESFERDWKNPVREAPGYPGKSDEEDNGQLLDQVPRPLVYKAVLLEYLDKLKGYEDRYKCDEAKRETMSPSSVAGADA
jgi:hypothetical protein